MKKSLIRFYLILVVLNSSTGCGFRIDKNTSTPSPEAPPTISPTLVPLAPLAPVASPAPLPSSMPSSMPAQITFAAVQDRIFNKQCLECHDINSGHPKHKVAVNTYAMVMNSIKLIQQEALVDKEMPPDSPLSVDDQKLLQSWIDEGALP